MKSDSMQELELTLQLDGHTIGSIHIGPHQSLVTNAISGETIVIAENDENVISDFFQRYLLTPMENALTRRGNIT